MFLLTTPDKITTQPSANPISVGTLSEGKALFAKSPIRSVPPVLPFILKISPRAIPSMIPPEIEDKSTFLMKQ